jgi:hypothetical protein
MKALSVLLTLTALMLSACASPRQAFEIGAPAAQPAPAPSTSMEIAMEKAVLDEGLGPAPRMIVRRASLTLVVEDTMAAVDAIRQIAEATEGYIAESNAYRVGEQMQATVTIRVPAEEMDRILKELKDMAIRVDRENISTEDVTEEYTDIESRLRNLEATEQELLALLREVRARPNATAEDILNVHRRITEVREEIERLKGRQQYLDTLVALATITIELIPDELTRPVIEPGWRPLQTLRSAFRALVRALQKLIDLAIWLTVFVLPILILIAIPFTLLLLVIRWIRGRRVRQD